MTSRYPIRLNPCKNKPHTSRPEPNDYSVAPPSDMRPSVVAGAFSASDFLRFDVKPISWNQMPGAKTVRRLTQTRQSLGGVLAGSWELAAWEGRVYPGSSIVKEISSCMMWFLHCVSPGLEYVRSRGQSLPPSTGHFSYSIKHVSPNPEIQCPDTGTHR